MRGRRWCAFELEGHAVDVAPVPVLSRFVRADHRVCQTVKVCGGMPPRRLVTATHMPALLTYAQVDPVPAALGKTVLATGGGRCDVPDLVEVTTGHCHRLPPVAVGVEGAPAAHGDIVTAVGQSARRLTICDRSERVTPLCTMTFGPAGGSAASSVNVHLCLTFNGVERCNASAARRVPEEGRPHVAGWISTDRPIRVGTKALGTALAVRGRRHGSSGGPGRLKKSPASRNRATPCARSPSGIRAAQAPPRPRMNHKPQIHHDY
jgi:hypothetical protein